MTPFKVKEAAEQAEFPLICVLRNERDILPAFLNHYRALGVTCFHFVDTGSTDGTIEYLMGQEDTQLYLEDGGYAKANVGMDWVNTIANRYCLGKWTITADADEFLHLPTAGSALALKQVTEQMRRELAFGLYTPLIDFFSDNLSTPQQVANSLQELVANSPNYVPFSNYQSRPVQRFPFFELRTKARAHISGNLDYSVRAQKIPLVFWRAGFQYIRSTHVCTPIPLSEHHGHIFHFKYRPGFQLRLAKELQNPDRLNGDVYQVSRDIVKNQGRIKENTVPLTANHTFERSDWSTEPGFPSRWKAENRSKPYYFDVLAGERSISDSVVNAKFSSLTGSTSWRLTKPIRAFLFNRGILRHDYYPERLKGKDVEPEQLIALYDSFWWLITGFIRVPKALRRSVLWHRFKRHL